MSRAGDVHSRPFPYFRDFRPWYSAFATIQSTEPDAPQLRLIDRMFSGEVRKSRDATKLANLYSAPAATRNDQKLTIGALSGDKPRNPAEEVRITPVPHGQFALPVWWRLDWPHGGALSPT
jgi:hypothetical protein